MKKLSHSKQVLAQKNITAVEKQINDGIARFIEQVRQSENSFRSACETLVDLLTVCKREKLFGLLQAKVNFSPDVLDRMVKIGRKELPFALLFEISPGTQHIERQIASGSLSLPAAEKIIGDNVPFVYANGNGGYETDFVGVGKLGSGQVQQVFDGPKVRDAKEQQTFLEKRRISRATAPTAKPWTFIDNMVMFRRDVKMSKEQAAEFIRDWFLPSEISALLETVRISSLVKA